MSSSQSNPRPPWQPILLLAIVALAAGALLTARSGRVAPDAATGPAADDPEAAVTALLQAERDGEVAAYRAHLAGTALQQFEARLRTSPSSQVAAELRSGLADLKGHAMTELTHSAPDAATLVLELIFADRNERQQLELRRSDGAWKVTRRTPAERLTPKIPYGTPVVPTPPAPHEP